MSKQKKKKHQIPCQGWLLDGNTIIEICFHAKADVVEASKRLNDAGWKHEWNKLRDDLWVLWPDDLWENTRIVENISRQCGLDLDAWHDA